MQLNILFLCNRPVVGNDANTIVDHIDAFKNYSRHKIWIHSGMGDISSKLDFNKFDAIIIHYSLCILNNHYLSQKAKKRIADYKGLKIIFVQDEYRQINTMRQELKYLNVDVLFSCFCEEEIKRIYPDAELPGSAKFNNLTGYIPKRLLSYHNVKPIAERTVHVGYRGRCLPFWYGELGYEKWDIVEKWKQNTIHEKLNADISYNENDRIYGEKWIEFIGNCKTTLGVESGASVMDFTGELEKKIEKYQFLHPRATFHQVQAMFLKEHEGKYYLNQISPRCFEAIALKTALVLYEGNYSGILMPGRHYIELKKDFSNIHEVLTKIKDDNYLQELVDRAYNEIALNPQYSYSGFIEKVDDVINREFIARNKSSARNFYTDEQFKKHIQYVSLKTLVYQSSLSMYQKMPANLKFLIKLLLRPRNTFRMIGKNYFKFINKA